MKNIIIAFTLISGHQLFEFLSLTTNNQFVYKTGLVLSISSMYFFIHSLEVVLNRNLRSKLALIVIGIIAIHAFLVEMSFESYSFYLKHNSAFIWASAWMMLFIYFHICALKGRKFLKNDTSKKAIIMYLLAILDISFLLAVFYTLWWYSQFSVNVCTESSSIWCTFYVIQIFALSLFLPAVPEILEIPEKKSYQTIKETFLYLLILVTILGLLITTLPFFKCLSLKFVFP